MEKCKQINCKINQSVANKSNDDFKFVNKKVGSRGLRRVENFECDYYLNTDPSTIKKRYVFIRNAIFKVNGKYWAYLLKQFALWSPDCC